MIVRVLTAIQGQIFAADVVDDPRELADTTAPFAAFSEGQVIQAKVGGGACPSRDDDGTDHSTLPSGPRRTRWVWSWHPERSLGSTGGQWSTRRWRSRMPRHSLASSLT